MARTHLEFQRVLSPILPYAFSVGCVAIALGVALASGFFGVPDFELPVFELAIALIAWFAGLWPSIVAVVLSSACFTYFFTEPRYSFEVSSGDIPIIVLFIAWAVIVASFVNVRRRVESDLRETRDHLEHEVEQRKQQEAEVRKLNQELVRRAAELDASNKELESFAYSVSHDLRAPLRHTVGFSELLQKHASSLLDEKSRRYIQTILEASQRMGNLIDDLLSFSRIGRAETKKMAVSLDQLVSEAVTEVSQDTGGRDIAWKIDALPVCFGDRAMLKLVIVNLISNAVKFTRMRPRAQIEIGCRDVDQDQVEVFVRDNGAGFDMRYANKLFGVFQRLHRAEEFEGTGIGLATVQRIIHRHGGQVRADGALDRGASFYFSLSKMQNAAGRTVRSL